MQKTQWRPLSFLPALAHHIDAMLLADLNHYANLLRAKGKPHLLDHQTIHEVLQVFSSAKNDLPLYDTLLQQWEREYLTSTQRQEIFRLKVQMHKLHRVIDTILSLANELRKGTNEKQRETTGQDGKRNRRA